MTRIVLADDHPVLREGLAALLKAAGFEIVGEAGDSLEAIRLAERAKPDVVILDLTMPGLDGLEACRELGKRAPRSYVVILSMRSDQRTVFEAFRNGARAYVLKEASSQHLAEAIREVIAGRHYLSPQLSRRAVEAYVETAKATSLEPYDELTSRERQVLQLAAQGLTAAQIGERLFISPRTVETHRANLMRKLELDTQTDLIRYAIRRGIISMDEG
jgi:DNA-binding NarL/FixJ family response regulator